MCDTPTPVPPPHLSHPTHLLHPHTCPTPTPVPHLPHPLTCLSLPQVSKCEKFGYGCMVTQLASTAAGILELSRCGEWWITRCLEVCRQPTAALSLQIWICHRKTDGLRSFREGGKEGGINNRCSKADRLQSFRESRVLAMFSRGRHSFVSAMEPCLFGLSDTAIYGRLVLHLMPCRV